MTDFTPLNPLETTLAAAQAGTLPPSQLFAALHGTQVFVLINKQLGPDTPWDEETALLVLNGQAGTPVVAVFSAAERAIDWPAQAPAFRFGLWVEFRWLLGGIAPELGIAINPGAAVGLELAPAMLQQLRDSIAAQTRPALEIPSSAASPPPVPGTGRRQSDAPTPAAVSASACRRAAPPARSPAPCQASCRR